MIFMLFITSIVIHETHPMEYSIRERKRRRTEKLNTLIKDSDVTCRSKLHMNRHPFYVYVRWLAILAVLRGTKNMLLEEIIFMFLRTLAHKLKNNM